MSIRLITSFASPHERPHPHRTQPICLKLSSRFLRLDTREKNEAFGSSLLLANSPMSPKIVNGSFAAIFDADEFLAKVYAGIRISVSVLHGR